MAYTLSNQKITQILQVINEITTKFPMMEIEDINFVELEKITKVSRKDFLTMLSFMDCLKRHQVYVDMSKVSKMKVISKGNNWRFTVFSKKHDTPLKLKHTFNI